MYDEINKMGHKLIWLFMVVVLFGILSSVLKIKEEFRSRGQRNKKNRASKAKVNKTTNVAKVSKVNKAHSVAANRNTVNNVMLASAIVNSQNRRRPNKKNMKNNILKLKNNNVTVPNDASIEFGAGIGGKEVNAGKIRYGGWDGGALNIVGAGGNGAYRNVRLWDKLQVGPLEIQEDGCIGYGPGKKFTFCFQSDGNIVQYKDKKPIWATGVPS